MRRVAGARKPEVQKLFRYFNSFMEAEPNDLDVLVCDEAHRLRKTPPTATPRPPCAPAARRWRN